MKTNDMIKWAGGLWLLWLLFKGIQQPVTRTVPGEPVPVRSQYPQAPILTTPEEAGMPTTPEEAEADPDRDQAPWMPEIPPTTAVTDTVHAAQAPYAFM